MRVTTAALLGALLAATMVGCTRAEPKTSTHASRSERAPSVKDLLPETSGEPVSEELADAVLAEAMQSVRDAQRTYGTGPYEERGEPRDVYDFVASICASVGGKGYAAEHKATRRAVTILELYSVDDASEQGRIIQRLTDEREARGWNPIFISFRKAGEWKEYPVDSSGAQLKVRGDHTILREELIGL